MNKGKLVMLVWLIACIIILFSSVNSLSGIIIDADLIDKVEFVMLLMAQFVLCCVLFCYLQSEKMPGFIINMQKQKNINTMILFFSLLSTNIFIITTAIILNIALFVYDNLVENDHNSTLTGQNLVIEILKAVFIAVIVAVIIKNIGLPEEINNIDFHMSAAIFLLIAGSIFLLLLCYLNYGHIQILSGKLNIKAHIFIISTLLVSLFYNNEFWFYCLFPLFVLNLHKLNKSLGKKINV